MWTSPCDVLCDTAETPRNSRFEDYESEDEGSSTASDDSRLLEASECSAVVGVLPVPSCIRTWLTGTRARILARAKSGTIRYHNLHQAFRSNFRISFCVGFYVAIWSMPLTTFFYRGYFFGESDYKLRAMYPSFGHHWCNLTLNTSAVEVDTATCKPRVTDESEQPDASGNKTCTIFPQRRFFGHDTRVWIGNDADGYFPIVAGNPPIMVLGSDADFAERCRAFCELSAECAKWYFWFSRPLIGGFCYSVPETAPEIPGNDDFAGGYCQDVRSQYIECPSGATGRLRNIAEDVYSQPVLVSWNDTMNPKWDIANPTDIWCGLLPHAFADDWPYIAQMMIFTMARHTGSTMKLAFQGLAGTFTACANFIFMRYLYRKGAACTGAELASGDCRYNAKVAWLDTFGVILLLLFSNAERNTVMFGLSWHIFFMMSFMNPNNSLTSKGYYALIPGVLELDNWEVIVFTMSCMGAALAVLATFVPLPHLNIRSAYRAMSTSVDAVGQIWRDAIGYYCESSKRSASRFQVATKMNVVGSTVANIDNDLQDAWWERCGGLERRREAYLATSKCFSDVREVMLAMRTCVLGQKFNKEHQAYSEALLNPMEGLCVEATHVAALCMRHVGRGWHRSEFVEAIREGVASVREKQAELSRAHHKASPRICVELADEAIFAFALSYSARKITDLGDNLMSTGNYGASEIATECSVCRLVIKGIRDTWAQKSLMQRQKLTAAARSFLSIFICYMVGYYTQNLVGGRYSPVMPNTVALLIANEDRRGTGAQRNLHRLLGVTLGKVLPILVNTALNFIFPCGTARFERAHFVAVWMFVGVCNYIAFTSPSSSWAYVGLLIGAFGVYPLFTPCDHEDFEDRYAEIGQVTLAISVQALVDTLFQSRSAGDLAVKEAQRISEAIQAGYNCFFDSDLQGMQDALREADSALIAATALVPECDPNIRVFKFLSTPFNQRPASVGGSGRGVECW